MHIKYITFSEIGRRRSNQDVCRVVEMPEYNRTLFVVCDGMGGHAMGDVAAETVSSAICDFWEENPECHDSVQKVAAACSHASDALNKRSRVVRPIDMGTTLVMASLEGDTVTIANCGDSRCYLLRNGKVLYQTEDHIGYRYGCEVVTKCFFSMNPEVAVPDVAEFKVQRGDRIFLCSDGVYKAIAPEILAARLQDDKPLEEIADVIKFLCEKNSMDNYTGILVEIM